jgi:peptidoglycan hydrolase CwlO-like protein
MKSEVIKEINQKLEVLSSNKKNLDEEIIKLNSKIDDTVGRIKDVELSIDELNKIKQYMENYNE